MTNENEVESIGFKHSVCSGGRKAVFVPDHPCANNRGYILEYRWVMEQHLGRRLLPSEHVHHKNGDSGDNRIENLELLNCSEHIIYHNKQRRKLDYDWIKTLRSKGMGYKKIANETGYARSSIRGACKTMGV